MGKDSKDKSANQQELICRQQQPTKVAYQTAKEALRALQETKRHNVGTPLEAANRNLTVYHDGDTNVFHIGHQN